MMPSSRTVARRVLCCGRAPSSSIVPPTPRAHPNRTALATMTTTTTTTTTTTSQQKQQQQKQQQQKQQQQRWHSTSSSSVNPQEVSHFNALASDWWDPHGSSRLLHLMNPMRQDFIRSCLESRPETASSVLPESSLTYLDIGCGGGIFAESAARLPTTKSVTAIDPTPSVLAVAKAHAKKDPSLAGKLSYRQSSIEELEPPRDGYDVVTLFEVIEHVDRPGPFLQRVRPFVKPGGWLVMSTIARTWMSWFTTNLVAEQLLRIVPPGTHDWNKYINEDELRRFLVRRGWASPRVMGVVYVPGLGWREVRGGEKVGNYFFAVRRSADEQ